MVHVFCVRMNNSLLRCCSVGAKARVERLPTTGPPDVDVLPQRTHPLFLLPRSKYAHLPAASSQQHIARAFPTLLTRRRSSSSAGHDASRDRTWRRVTAPSGSWGQRVAARDSKTARLSSKHGKIDDIVLIPRNVQKAKPDKECCCGGTVGDCLGRPKRMVAYRTWTRYREELDRRAQEEEAARLQQSTRRVSRRRGAATRRRC